MFGYALVFRAEKKHIGALDILWEDQMENTDFAYVFCLALPLIRAHPLVSEFWVRASVGHLSKWIGLFLGNSCFGWF